MLWPHPTPNPTSESAARVLFDNSGLPDTPNRVYTQWVRFDWHFTQLGSVLLTLHNLVRELYINSAHSQTFYSQVKIINLLPYRAKITNFERKHAATKVSLKNHMILNLLNFVSYSAYWCDWYDMADQLLTYSRTCGTHVITYDNVFNHLQCACCYMAAVPCLHWASAAAAMSTSSPCRHWLTDRHQVVKMC